VLIYFIFLDKNCLVIPPQHLKFPFIISLSSSPNSELDEKTIQHPERRLLLQVYELAKWSSMLKTCATPRAPPP
jgi:hypothetical protein